MTNKASPNEKAVDTPFNGHSTDCQKVNLPMPREFNGKKYYGAADVAKILGVDKTTVWHWQNDLYFDCPLFTADERAHDGRYLYEIERVMQLKSVIITQTGLAAAMNPLPKKKIMPYKTAIKFQLKDIVT